MTLDATKFELAPGQQRDVAVTVDVPADPEPGERYVGVLFAVPGSDDDNISLTHRLGAKLFIDVPGEATRRLELGELSAPRIVDGAATLQLPVHNRGNTHRRFVEPDQLMATAGDVETLFENFTVLGGSTRVVEAVWEDPPAFCWCTVEVRTDDGQGNPLLATARILVFPIRLTLSGLVAALGFAMLIRSRQRRRAERLARQLEAARQEGYEAAQRHSVNA